MLSKIGVAAFASLALAEPPVLHWWQESGSAPQASTVCSSSSGLCHSFGHFVFLATPGGGDPTVKLDGVARFATDDGPMVAGPAPMFEKHLVSGICVGPDHSDCSEYGPSQVFQLNSLTVEAMTTDSGGKLVPPSTLPKTICAEVDMFETLAPSKQSHAPKVCAKFTEPVVLDDQVTELSVELNTFSTVATSIKHGDKWQNDFHVMFFMANPNPTHVLEAFGSYSTDNWMTSASEVGIYEQHVNLRDDGFYKQAWQFNAEFLSDEVLEAPICYNITIKDTVTHERSMLDACIMPCKTLVPFHNAAGYCPFAAQV